MGDVIKDIRSFTKKFRVATSVSATTTTTTAQKQHQKNDGENARENEIALIRDNVNTMMQTNASWKKEWCTGDAMLLRFLNAFGNAADATQKISLYFQWRLKDRIDDLDPEDPALCGILAEQANTVLDNVCDTKGRPILVITPRHHHKNVYTDEQVFRSAVYSLEKVCQKCDDSQNTGFCMIYNLEGFTKANMDFSFAQRYFKCLKDYYPERVGVGLIINFPAIVHPFWKVVKVWMNPRMRNRFVFCSKKQFKDYVDVNELPIKLFTD